MSDNSKKLTFDDFKNALDKDKNKNNYNEENIYKFVNKYIMYINENENIFSQKNMESFNYNFYLTDIKNYLHDKLNKSIKKDPSFKDVLWKEFKDFKLNDGKIKNIAIKHRFFHGDLRKLFRQIAFEKMTNTKTSIDEVANLIIEKISKDEKEYCKSMIMPILEKSLYLVLKGGFDDNLTDIDPGIMKSNAGDAAEFLFVGRAILAGYNCSQVDVRTSGYDAIIDVNGNVYRVQIKGFSDKTVSFVTQARGGQGSDPSNKRNKSKKVTSQDCDLYVAVDKRTGLCYIVPIDIIEQIDKKTVNVKIIEKYKENWGIIDSLPKIKKHT